MRITKYLLLFICGLFLAGQTGWGAERSYVTDSFKVTLRTGPSIQNKIVMMLRSGQPVEVLEAKDNWSHVRLARRNDEIEGWVLTRYLIKRLPWELQAGALLKENDQLKKRLVLVEKKWREAAGKERRTAEELAATSRALTGLKRKYEALEKGAADYLKLKTSYDKTKAELIRSRKKVSDLSRENDILISSQRNKWFGMGALVLLCGLLIGLIMGRYQKKKKSTILI
ncbi:MAG: TIGR04211 family SH3 domain-containing protein [Deltaproteobacteria bacterium]|nr:MAG: TIGR04211 family SH3 domain-containing protein [Deltaproteobacteria bacterium]